MLSSQSNYALNMEVALDTRKSIEVANLFKAARVLYCSASVFAGICLLDFMCRTLRKTIQLPAHVISMFTICICGRLVITAGEETIHLLDVLALSIKLNACRNML